MNNLSKTKTLQVVSMLKEGKSCRSIEISTKVHQNTVLSLKKRQKIVVPRKKPRLEPNRDRSGYHLVYYKNKPYSHTDRLKRNDMLRADIQIFLAGSSVPVSNVEVYQRFRYKYPALRQEGITNMLRTNCEDCFIESMDGWSYKPSRWMITNLSSDEIVQARWKARAVYFDRIGKKDELVEIAIQCAINKNKNHTQKVKDQALNNVREFFQIINVASKIGK